jgi:predicted esterase YcpF (UPF0227 family)
VWYAISVIELCDAIIRVWFFVESVMLLMIFVITTSLLQLSLCARSHEVLGLVADAESQKKIISSEKIKYIKKNYEHTLFGKQHLFYPATQAQRLLVLFMGAQKNKYLMWTWFWTDRENWKNTAYLFLRDDEFCWYIGNNKKSFIEDYSKIIAHYISVCALKANKVITIGSSMGAYGAILYAALLGLKGVIALNPQVNKESNEVLRYEIQKTESRWIDLDKVVASCPKVPCVSLTFAYDPRDQAASYALINVLKQRTQLLVIRRFPSSHHAIAPLVFSKKFLADEISYIENSTQFIETKDFIIEEKDDEFEFA